MQEALQIHILVSIAVHFSFTFVTQAKKEVIALGSLSGPVHITMSVLESTSHSEISLCLHLPFMWQQ